MRDWHASINYFTCLSVRVVSLLQDCGKEAELYLLIAASALAGEIQVWLCTVDFALLLPECGRGRMQRIPTDSWYVVVICESYNGFGRIVHLLWDVSQLYGFGNDKGSVCVLE
jgi:hypothetical protein